VHRIPWPAPRPRSQPAASAGERSGRRRARIGSPTVATRWDPGRLGRWRPPRLRRRRAASARPLAGLSDILAVDRPVPASVTVTHPPRIQPRRHARRPRVYDPCSLLATVASRSRPSACRSDWSPPSPQRRGPRAAPRRRPHLRPLTPHPRRTRADSTRPLRATGPAPAISPRAIAPSLPAIAPSRVVIAWPFNLRPSGPSDRPSSARPRPRPILPGCWAIDPDALAAPRADVVGPGAS
jgi:hypothetical protein